MITLTAIQRLVLIDSLERMEDTNQSNPRLDSVINAVNIGNLDLHKMHGEQVDIIRAAINDSTFWQQLLDEHATDRQMATVKHSMETLCLLLSMYHIDATFKTLTPSVAVVG